MLNTRLDTGSRWLAFALTAGLFAAPLAAQETKDSSEKKDKPAASKQAPESKPETSKKGIVLRPKSVDGSVSAYSAAVREADPEARVFTNADLEKMWAGDPGAWATTPSTGGDQPAAPADGGQEALADPLAWMESQKGSAQERAKSIAAAEQELTQAQAAVAQLEKQLLAVRNPFSARPQLSDEEKAARADGDTTAARLARTQEQLDLARQRVKDAETRLNMARRSR